MANPIVSPTPAPPSVLKTFFAHFLSWHALMLIGGQAVMILGLLTDWTAQVPQLAQAHALLVAIGAVITAAGAIKASLFKTPTEKTLIKLGCATLPPAARPGASGTITTAVLLLLIPALALQGCAWGQCVLGKLKAAEQTIIVDVTTDLGSADYMALLAALAAIVGEPVVTCTVQAIVAYEQAKAKAVKPGEVVPPNPILDHSAAWLNAHKAVACGERYAS